MRVKLTREYVQIEAPPLDPGDVSRWIEGAGDGDYTNEPESANDDLPATPPTSSTPAKALFFPRGCAGEIKGFHPRQRPGQASRVDVELTGLTNGADGQVEAVTATVAIRVAHVEVVDDLPSTNGNGATAAVTVAETPIEPVRRGRVHGRRAES
jgi:hypothetical protein